METTLSPLARKLKLKPGTRAAVVGASPGYLAQLAPPSDVDVSETLDGGPFDWIQVFVRTSADLAAVIQPLTAAIAPTAHVCISYPKGSSKMQTDLTRDKGWEPLEGSDLMWLSLVSVDDTWSAFGLRPHKPGEARQTFR
jgi:hypothetical protein